MVFPRGDIGIVTGYRCGGMTCLDVAVGTQLRSLGGTLVLAVVLTPGLHAAESGVRACFGEKDDAHRLACYDTEVGKMVMTRVAAHVAGIKRKPSGWVVVRLDNGEVWEQSDQGPDLGLTVGDSVKIEKGFAGGVLDVWPLVGGY